MLWYEIHHRFLSLNCSKHVYVWPGTLPVKSLKSFIYFYLLKSLMIKNTVKQLNCEISKISVFPFDNIWKCNLYPWFKAVFISPVFSVTWSFRNDDCCSKNIYCYYQCWRFLLLNVETVIPSKYHYKSKF